MRLFFFSALIVLVAGCFSMSKRPGPLERRLVFQPRTYPAGDWEPKNFEFEDAWFTSADGVRIHGWFCEAKKPRAVVLYCHGNAGNVTSRVPALKGLRDNMNVSVLCFDYRGYGRSKGHPYEEGILADARAARRWLAKRTKVQEKDIILYGRSLGGAVAVDLAAKDGAQGLVLHSTFTSLKDVANAHTSLPVASVMKTRLDSMLIIEEYRGPLLQTHGSFDQVVPFKLGLRLFEAANEPKKFVPMTGGRHNGPSSAEFLTELNRFFDTYGLQQSKSEAGLGFQTD